ncbi:hypothetical protein PIB30_033807 [Stylosanthes scabra]|uniref:Uncharacterized protein n=1 Tax=Stylosanthes scabra TaxID=79078 RepID=A0ABU6XB20_9FABA|nr:hypothetical protein [Stylosanthes scabra]
MRIRVDPPSTNDSGNVNTNNVDPIVSHSSLYCFIKYYTHALYILFTVPVLAKKNKKKMPLKPGVRVKQPKERATVEEIQISQNAPHAEEHGNSSQGVNQNVGGQTSAMGASGVSAETIAATSSGTAARLFKFMPTPGFKPPRQK